MNDATKPYSRTSDDLVQKMIQAKSVIAIRLSLYCSHAYLKTHRASNTR